MAHSEMYPDGSRIDKFVSAESSKSLAEKFGKLSSAAFMKGAERVEQRLIHGNETCPKCDSGLRFDLCCGT